MQTTTCSVRNCPNNLSHRGYCQKHYREQLRNGNRVNISGDGGFWAKVEKTAACWLWRGSKSSNGYGRYVSYRNGVKVQHVMAHRYAYQLASGPIPEEMQIDHTCHVLTCVNPSHLRLVTPKQNKENRSGAQKNSSSGVRGVCWNTKSKKWQAGVGHNRASHYLGLFDNLADAEAAVIEKRLELFTHNDLDRN